MTMKNPVRILSAACALLIAALTASVIVNIMQFQTPREAPAPAAAVSDPGVSAAAPQTASEVSAAPAAEALRVTRFEYFEWSGCLRIGFSAPVRTGDLAASVRSEPAIDFAGMLSGRSPSDAAAEFVFYPVLEPETFYRIVVPAGLTGADGNCVLARDSSFNLVTPGLRPEIEPLTSGRVFPPGGNLWSLPFAYTNLDKVKFTLCEGYANNQNTEAGQSFYMSRLAGEREYRLPEAERNGKGYFTLELGDLIPDRKPGFYVLCAEGRDMWGRSWPLTISDLGLSAAVTGDQAAVSVHSLTDGRPLAGAEVLLISRKNQTLAEGESDENGIALLEYDTASDPDDSPAFFRVSLAGDCNTLNCRPYDRSLLDLSEFDLAGSVSGRGLIRALVYPVRDLARPGEKVRVVILMRDAAGGGAPGEQPLGAAILDPEGRVLRRELLECTDSGFAEMDFSLPANAPQGYYRVVVGEPGNETGFPCGEASVLAADFRPDTAKIAFDEGNELKGSAGYFFGQPLSGAPVRAVFSADFRRFAPPEHPGYTFGMPEADRNIPVVFSGTVCDADGRFRLETPDFGIDGVRTGGVLVISASASVTPPAGRTVTAVREFTRCTDDFYLGALACPTPDGALNVEWLAADPDGELRPMECDTLEWTLETMEWNYLVVKNSEGRWERSWNRRCVAETSGVVPIPQGATGGEFTIPGPLKSDGCYRLTVSDPVTGGRCRLEVDMVNEEAGVRSRNRMVMHFVSDRPEYRPGDEALISFTLDNPGPVTVIAAGDNGLEVFETAGAVGENVFRYRIPEDYATGCARLAFTALSADPEGEREIGRSFGMAVLPVNQDGHKLEISAVLPEEATPGERLEIPVEVTSGGAPVRAEVRAWAVHSGILSLSFRRGGGFFDHFFGRRANAASFFDCYGELYPALRLGDLGLPGGDFGAAMAKFLPPGVEIEPAGDVVALPVNTDEEGRCVVTLEMPYAESCEYTVFIAAASSGGVGETSRKLLVRREAGAAMSAPRAVASGDEFRIGLELFNHRSPDENISWRVDFSAHLTLKSGESSGVCTLRPGESQLVELTFTAGEGSAPAAIVASVSSNGAVSDVRRAVLIRRPVLPESRTTLLTVPAGGELRYRPGHNDLSVVTHAKLSVGGRAAAITGRNLGWLNAYPYGCSEQMTSMALPLLAAEPLIRKGILPEAASAGASEAVAETLLRLRSNQTGSGGFRTWNNDAQEDPDLSAYVGFFLISASARGFALPENMLENLCGYLQSRVLNSRGPGSMGRRALAGLVLAEAGIKCVPALEAFAFEARDDGSAFELAVAGAALCAAGRGETGLGCLREGISARPWAGNEYDGCWDSSIRRMSILLSLAVRYMPGDPLTRTLAAELEEAAADASNTQEIGWSAFALSGWLDVAGAEGAAFRISGGGSDISGAPGESGFVRLDGEDSAVIRNDGPGELAVSVLLEGMPLANREVSSGLTLTRRFLDGDGREITRVGTGELFTMELNIASNSSGAVEDLVIAALLPGGVEAEDVRLASRGSIHLPASGAPRRSELLADRVLIFDRALPEGRTIHIPLRATAGGVFVIPPATAEDMYHPAIRAVCPSPAEKLVVE